MARGGVNKFHVKQAREVLLAKGQQPTLDAVRQTLGNTGSRTTIHRYMRELDEEESTRLGEHSLLSETLKDLVGRLSAQLQAEAQEIVEQQRILHSQQLADLQAQLNEANKQREISNAEIDRLERALAEEQTSHQTTTSKFQQEQIRSNQLAQEVTGLREQLAISGKHLSSLEEKHQQARDALDHYRQSIKDMRDQDQRRHEQQIQHLQSELRQLQQTLIVKQGEITGLSKETVRMATELTEARKQLHREQLTSERALKQMKEKERLLEERHCEAYEQMKALRDELKKKELNQEESALKLHDAQQLIGVLQVKLEAQEELVGALKAARVTS